MLALLMVAGAAGAAPDVNLPEVKHAIEAGRIDQARSMIAAAIAAGSSGEPVERLLADLAFASRDDVTALARYAALVQRHSNDGMLLERAAISAARLGDVDQARAFARRATSAADSSWRAWNVLGVTADIRGDFADADSSYARAQELAPDQPELLNNIGWSYLLRGEWAGAIAPLKRAAGLMPNSPRIANNLQLAIAALSENLPARGERESEVAWAARLNDAGVAAQIRGQHKRAVAAFAQALEARGSWYERAANNLRSVEAKQ